MSARKLTAKQERFVSEYLLDLNATAACKRAGYSARTAHSCGPRLLANAGVASEIASAKKERAEATKVDVDWVLRQAVELYQGCMQEVKPALHPKTRRQMTDDDGHRLFTFNAAAANRSLELIGKHVEINAFNDKLKIDGTDEIIKLIQQGRERVGMPEPIA
jgi:phage terminase small subunit